MTLHSGSSTYLIEKLLRDGKPRTANEIVTSIERPGLSRNAIVSALTWAAKRDIFAREKIDGVYVYRLPERAA